MRSPARWPVKSGSSQRRSLCSEMCCWAKASRLLKSASSAPYSSAVEAASFVCAVQNMSRWRIRTARRSCLPSQPVWPSIQRANAIGSSVSSCMAASMRAEMPRGKPPVDFSSFSFCSGFGAAAAEGAAFVPAVVGCGARFAAGCSGSTRTVTEALSPSTVLLTAGGGLCAAGFAGLSAGLARVPLRGQRVKCSGP